MSRKYKFYNKEGLYFVSFATVYWLDVFVRDLYFDRMLESLDYCRKEKGMEIFCWCIMPSHVHLIFRAKDNNPGELLKSLKTFTSKALQASIENNMQESRREWMLWLMQRAGTKNSNVKKRQFWQQHNHPIELWSAEVIDQKVNYIHQNPVVSGFVTEAHHWKYSSAIDYSGGKGVLAIDFV
ncbi:transposase [Pelobium manganitolerans]|uniref:Transposase n=1 Tax=Pelobium manganitolerans TaxID=1842495 RepID=A0A419S6H1_9SPHI|nr:transposase [Pelobium manganitolerans]RKD12903.1 transposase [Pelobium manganitolerans]RKD16574.1 transposase [Pelobium manganitolerans]RKD16576.1 transposase [Pelobium manganitolerans]RKD18022.1 transposase [Pelobium manganitolerans]